MYTYVYTMDKYVEYKNIEYCIIMEYHIKIKVRGCILLLLLLKIRLKTHRTFFSQ
jgi:hypothetical protein